MKERRRLSLALLVALALTAVAVAFRALGDASGTTRPVSEILPLLFAAAGLCAAGLLRHRSPAGAWLATVSVGGLAALEILGAVRGREASTSPESWPWLVLVAQGAIAASAWVAGLYAARTTSRRPATAPPSRWFRVWRAVVYAGLATVAVSTGFAVVAAFGGAPGVVATSPADEASPFRISARLGAAFVAVMTIAGALRDLSGPVRRARARTRNAREWPGALAEELLPGAGTMRRLGRDEERARLAADLHALVLPDLRRAADAAAKASADTGKPVAAELRQALAGVERLMHERHSVVLEEYGLVAALEWLAERTEEQSPTEVAIELEGGRVDDRSATPPEVERAAFRIALLAVDNVVRHSGAAHVALRLVVDDRGMRMVVADDGGGIDTRRSAPTGRGLIDMRAAAADVGASLQVEGASGGTRIALTWTKPGVDPGNHASAGVDLAGSPNSKM